ncbi:MAG TPA: ATP-dependent DNA helicase [Candidatus Saccharimonadales bacterium]|jgi:DNA helicase-2/ATP-dependent DNA helicase PcrA|nr:ATP-dependent DNA helicase [Candidatus Saccharimonadales bacterium]
MSSFLANYRALNAAQKQAVDYIDGPLMVIAGPGTGKTQLLSMRVANILQKTDVLPSNILCLTFTESGATAMRKRLIELMGQAAYGVAIHTFHSFGTEVINAHAEYFYHGAHFQAADQLSSYEVLRELFDTLPHDNPIASTMNGEFTHLRDTQGTISDLKKSGLTPDELLQVIDANDAFLAFAEPLIQPVFADRLSKKSFPIVETAGAEIAKFADTPLKVPGLTTLASLFTTQLTNAIESAAEQGSTKPLTAWRNNWLEKDADGHFVFKDRRRNAKLRAVAAVYYDYLVAMQERTLYDFDDMILRVVHAMEVFADLRYDLQEKYQYILVDEFQDTNGAQLRLLINLTNNEASAGRPNIMVVGDDDQAIYSFQGAEIGNILSFRDLYPQVKTITLTENYRSTATILQASRSVITQGESRLETTLDNINKQLTANHTHVPTRADVVVLPSVSDEYHWLVKQIKAKLDNGTASEHIAILARNHRQLMALVPYLHSAGIPVAYERRDNVLDSPPVVMLQLLARIIDALGEQAYDSANALLPELLAHPAWGIKTADLWDLSLTAYKEHRFWLEIMLTRDGKLKDIAEWLIIIAHQALHEPLEIMLDQLIGSSEVQAADTEDSEALEPFTSGPHEHFVSPLRAYFFEQSGLASQPATYLSYLGSLTTLRRALREYLPDKDLYISDFTHFIDLHHQIGIGIANTTTYQESDHAVQLMTAHKSKGLEFETVFVLSGQDHIWGSSSRARSNLISLPHNLPIKPVGETDDERLRLLYVAMTRARNELIISAHQRDANGKDVVLAKFLQTDELSQTETNLDQTSLETIQAAEATWHERLIELPKGNMQQLLAPSLEHYKLSATHLNNFIDVTAGGPQAFLLQNLLRFPQSMSPNAMFGSAIHTTLQHAHGHLSATGKRRPLEDILHDFEKSLAECHLDKRDTDYWLQKGTAALTTFLHERHDSFTEDQIVEKSFANQGIHIGDALLAGNIDLIDINKISHEIIVTDYKTGKALSSWQGKTDFEKIKLHKYKQQLMLYKLLIEHSRDYGHTYKVEIGVLEFVEPRVDKTIQRLETGFDDQELARFTTLIKVIWRHIMALDLPNTSQYEPTYKGILAFEADLLAGTI